MHWAIAVAVAWILLSKGRAAAGTWPGSLSDRVRGEGEDPLPGEEDYPDYALRHPPAADIVQPLPYARLQPIQDPFGDSSGGTVHCMAIGCEGGYPDYGLRLMDILKPASTSYLEDPIEGQPVSSYLPYGGGYRILPVIAE